jgi:tetratricopeptide (TPR) repeat protein
LIKGARTIFLFTGRQGGVSTLSCVLLVFALLAGQAEAATVKSFVRNREGISAFKRKNFYQAYQKFGKALEDDPLNPEIQMNLARTFDENEEFEKAEQGYRAALKFLPKDSSLRFMALFNWAGTLAKLKRIDESLAAYQEALTMDPDSLEVKTNIELLWQGGGGGGSDDKNQQKDNKQGDQQKQQQGQNDEPKEKKPKPFQSQQLSQDDVKRILDEIKNQEQAIRAQDYEKGAREMPKGKDW